MNQNNHNHIEEVLSIIDTRIQYINFQTNQIVSSITGFDVNQTTKPELSVKELSSFNFSHNKCDSFLTLMEEFSKSKRLLLMLRTQLRHFNAEVIFQFLSHPNWNRCTEAELTILLEESFIFADQYKPFPYYSSKKTALSSSSKKPITKS